MVTKGDPTILFDNNGGRYRVVDRLKVVAADTTDRLYIIEPIASGHELRLAKFPASLTKREKEVFELLAQRATNIEIAVALGISTHTARHHTQNILAKLNVRSRAEVRGWISGAEKCRE